MALKNKNNEYLKLTKISNGNYIVDVYKNTRTRNISKNSTDPQSIIAKYQELIELVNEDINNFYIKYKVNCSNRIYYEITFSHLPESIKAKLLSYIDKKQEIELEFAAYKEAINLNDVGNNQFKIMEEYFSDVVKTIPQILYTIEVAANNEVSTIENAYIDLKNRKIFGETKDC